MKREPKGPESQDFPLRFATRATLIYFAVAGLWILLSDQALEWLLRDPEAITQVQTYKGLLFVVVSSAILFVVWRRQLERWFAEHSARKKAEGSILFQAHMLDQVGQAVIATRLDGTVLYANRSAQRLYGWEEREMLGKAVHEIGRREQPPEQQAAIREGLRNGEPWSGEAFVRRRDGTTFPALLSDAPVSDERGEVIAVVSVASDMTERRAMESRVRQSQKLEAVGTLAGGIAHDFNNLLAAILGNAELARGAFAPGHPERESLEQIVAACNRARDLIRQLLAFSRQKDSAPHVECRLGEIVAEALRLLRPTWPAHVRSRVALAHDLPAVLGDPTQIHQVVMNLVTNALQALGEREGEVSVEVGLAGADDPRTRVLEGRCDGSCVRLRVADDGPGMDAATQERIFEPFFTTKEAWRGTGLGLAVVHGIVSSHGGAIVVDSQPGRGARFDVYFPAVRRGARGDSSEPEPPLPGKGERILFVDDEPALLRIGQLVLERAGYRVAAVGEADAALEELRTSGPYDLMVTDMLMPGMTGAQLAQRAREVQPDLKMLLSTGVGGEWSSAQCDEVGFAALVEKPWTADALGRAVQRALETPQR